jgi:hypothetical protein
MTDFTSSVSPKWWGRSLTIRGVLITAATAVLPAVATAAGIDVGLVRVFGEQAIGTLQSIGGLIGTGMAIAGRVRADGPVTTRDLTIRI